MTHLFLIWAVPRRRRGKRSSSNRTAARQRKMMPVRLSKCPVTLQHARACKVPRDLFFAFDQLGANDQAHGCNSDGPAHIQREVYDTEWFNGQRYRTTGNGHLCQQH